MWPRGDAVRGIRERLTTVYLRHRRERMDLIYSNLWFIAALFACLVVIFFYHYSHTIASPITCFLLSALCFTFSWYEKEHVNAFRKLQGYQVKEMAVVLRTTMLRGKQKASSRKAS